MGKGEDIMKKLLSVFITFTLVFTLSAVKSAGDDEVYDLIQFSSLEDYLNAYLASKAGGSIEEFTEGGYFSERINFTEFEILHLPTAILENFVIRRIRINEFGSMTFWFLPEDAEGPTNAFWQWWNDYPHFRLSIRESLYENGMELLLQGSNQTVDDLIDGKYFISRTYNLFISFTWVSDGMLFDLYIDLRSQDTEEFKELFGDGDVLDFVRFAETRAVDLTDTEAVLDLINFGERFLRGDVDGDGRVTTADALEILRYAAGLPNVIEGDERALAAADVNGDGKIDTADAMRILQIVAGLTSANN
jgi:hypothetical protein